MDTVITQNDNDNASRYELAKFMNRFNLVDTYISEKKDVDFTIGVNIKCKKVC